MKNLTEYIDSYWYGFYTVPEEAESQSDCYMTQEDFQKAVKAILQQQEFANDWSKEKPKKQGLYVTKNKRAAKGSQYHIVTVYRDNRKLVAKPEGFAEVPLAEIGNTEFQWLLLEEA